MLTASNVNNVSYIKEWLQQNHIIMWCKAAPVAEPG